MRIAVVITATLFAASAKIVLSVQLKSFLLLEQNAFFNLMSFPKTLSVSREASKCPLKNRWSKIIFFFDQPFFVESKHKLSHWFELLHGCFRCWPSAVICINGWTTCSQLKESYTLDPVQKQKTSTWYHNAIANDSHFLQKRECTESWCFLKDDYERLCLINKTNKIY